MQNGTTVEAARKPRKIQALPEVRVIKATHADVMAHWPMIRKRLLDLKHKYAVRCPHVPINWIPEHFRFEVLKNIANQGSSVELFLARSGHGEQETIDGFFITTLEYDSALHVPLDLLIWIACAWKPYVLEAALLQADDIAIQRGCVGLKHMSNFLGWGRRQSQMMERLRERYGLLAGADWKMQYVVWRRSLVPEELD